jgi:glycosyltransferase involved in cell wall biosynthesis
MTITKVHPYFSLIMTVYNGEQHLQAAIKSVLLQTCADFELFLVDDGSTDGTTALCRELVAKDARIKLTVLPEHVGVNKARNYVLGLTQGSYVTFVDADDYLDADALEHIYKFLHTQPVQVVKCGHDEEYYDEQNRLLGVKKYRPSSMVYRPPITNRADILFTSDKIHLFGFLWNGFYDREFLSALRVNMPTEYPFGMDFLFNLDICRQAASIAYLSYGGYHYCKRGVASLSSQRHSNYFAVQMCKVQAVLANFPEWVQTAGVNYQNFFWTWYVRSVYSQCCRQLVAAGHDAAVQELLSLYNSELFQKFQVQSFAALGWRQRFLIGLLQQKHTFLVTWLCYVMVGVQEYAPMLFARIKD